MNLNLPHNKVLWSVVEITQILNKEKCTFSDAEKVLQMVADELKQQRENIEYVTLDNYFADKKVNDASDKVVEALNHLDDYC